MKRFGRSGFIVLALAGLAAVQDKGAELYVQNTEQGVEIRAPKSPGKDQLWIAKLNDGKVYSNSGVCVSHRVDSFSVEAMTQRLADPMREKWPDKITEIAKNHRDGFLKEQKDGTPSNWKECRILEEDPKAKLPSLSGKCCMHRVALVDQKDNKKEIVQFFCIASEVLYIVSVTYDAEGYKKYWPREGQQILASIKRCKYEKPANK